MAINARSKYFLNVSDKHILAAEKLKRANQFNCDGVFLSLSPVKAFYKSRTRRRFFRCGKRCCLETQLPGLPDFT
jgi:hypothetical protein